MIINDTLKSIAERYSCRDYLDTPLSELQVNSLVEAALSSPSAMNLQPWMIIAITDKGIINELDVEGMRILAEAEDKSAYKRILSRGGKMFYNAPCMMLIVSDKLPSAAMDCGILCQTVALAAQSQGLGSVICGMAGVPLDGKNRNEYRKLLKIPEKYEFAISVLVGVAKSNKTPHEKDINRVTYITA